MLRVSSVVFLLVVCIHFVVSAGASGLRGEAPVAIVLSKEEENKLFSDAVLVRGPYFSGDANERDYGKVVDMRPNPDGMRKFEHYVNKKAPHVVLARHAWADGEGIDVIERFFWGLDGGLVLELGACDGTFLSQSKPMVEQLGWHRILIEGSPNFRSALKSNATDAFVVSAAVCGEPKYVHYASYPTTTGVGGIVEFMNPNFRNAFHGLGDDPSKFKLSDRLQRVACMPLSLIFRKMHVTHINYLSLDVEGAEMEILKSIDFNSVRFDIISVETEKAFRPEHYEAKVTHLLRKRGYVKIWSKGRNAWFRHPDFVISSRFPRRAEA